MSATDIQELIDGEQAPESKAVTLSPRDEKIAAIAARQMERELDIEAENNASNMQVAIERAIGAEYTESPADDESTIPQDVEKPAAAQASNAVIDALEKAGMKFEVGNDGKTYTHLKVNGEIRRVSSDDLPAILQKDLAGDAKLKKASDLLAEAQRIQSQAANNQLPKGVDSQAITGKANELIDEIFNGDPKVAAQKLADLVAASASPVVQPASLDLDAAVENAIAQREYRTDLKSGQTQFAEKFSDLAKDPYLRDMVNSETLRIEATHPDWSPSKIIMEAGKTVNDWRQKNLGATAKASTDASAREARKTTITRLPTSSARHVPEAKPSVDHSPGAVIARMRAQRRGLQGGV